MRSTRQRDPDTDDLGFGTQLATGRGDRLLRRDGTFTVRRRGRGLRAVLSLYHRLLTISWPAFLALVCTEFLLAHLLFGLAYTLLGPAALQGPGAGFERGFFFSVHTFTGVGYGHVWPASFGANVVATVEILVGLLSLALIAGLSFARLSRPSADLVFSRSAIVAPYPAASSGTALMLRVANQRHNQIHGLEAKVMLSIVEQRDGVMKRRFSELALERSRIVLFPLSWTIVHPIDADSPLAGMDAQALAAADAEVLVLLQGLDETFAQVVHARTSYVPREIRFGQRFSDAFERNDAGVPVAIDLRRVHATEPA